MRDWVAGLLAIVLILALSSWADRCGREQPPGGDWATESRW